MARIRIALVGIGKIARDQHVRALAANADFELVAAVSRHHRLDGVPNFSSLADLLDEGPAIDALAICTPPQVRYEIACHALDAGVHVMLEKPPGATLNEVESLRERAADRGATLFATWHSRAAAGVAPARRLLEGRRVQKVRIEWKEDVRVWHPGQTWIWQAGGLGVFDPGINALSIVTHILPERLHLTQATLAFPANCETPIAAELALIGERGAAATMSLDFLHEGPPAWDIDVEHDGGRLRLSRGGAILAVGDEAPVEAPDEEYPNLYRRFAVLVNGRQSDVDVEPLRLVADAFLCGRRHIVEPFNE